MLVREDDRVTKMRASQPQPPPPPRRAADFSRPPEVPFVSFDSCLPQQPKSKAIDKALLLPPLEKHLPIMSALASKPGASSFRHVQALPGSAVSVSKAPLSSYRSVHSALAELRPQEGLECLYGGAAAGGSSARVSPSVEWSSSGVVLEQFGAAREQFASRIISIPSSSSACANATAAGEQAIPNLSLHHSIHKSGPWTPVEISLSGDNAISSSTFNMAPQTGPSAVAATVVSQQANPSQSFHHNLLKAGLWQPSLSPGDGTIIRQLSTGSYTESLLSSDLPTSTLSPTVSLSTSESTVLGGYCEEARKEDAAKLAKVNDTSSQSWAQQTEQRYNLQLALALRLVATAELAEEPYLIANSKENRLSFCAAQCSATSTALRFWVNGSLGYSDKIQDGFYHIWGMNPHIWAICNDTKEGGHLPSLEVLRRVNPSDTSIEVVLFDKHGDSHLLDLENKARKLANKVASLNELAESLGKLICGLMGGAATLEDGELVSRWRASSNLLKDCFSCLVIPVGSLSVGLCRHRALLYKALADYVDLPCRIVRGCKYCGLSEGTSCLVLCGTEREWLVDLISKPGELSNAESFLKSLQSPPINSPLRLPDLKVAEMATGLQKGEVDFVMQLSDITQLGSLDARNLRDMLGVPLPFNGPVSARLGNVWPVIASSEMECKSSSVKLTKPDFQIGHKRPPIEGRNMSRVSEAPAPAAADMFVFERDLVWNKPVSGSEDGPYNIDNNNKKNITVKDQNPPDIGKIYLDDSLKKALPEKDAKEVDDRQDGIRKQAQSLNISLELDCFEIPWEDLILRERIGAGSFGTVHRADWHGSDVAVKILIEQDIQEQHLQEFVREVALMKRMRHPNVVLFMGAVTKRPNFSIVTEFLPRGSLFRLLHKAGVKESLDEKRRIRMALDVARGMNYLHRLTPPIVHRDLKSPNLLVDKTWTVKVCDFGLSRFKGNTFLSSRSAAGTPEWMAPEVLRDEPSNEKSDVYSFGVILWELVTLQQPWNGLNAAQVVGAVGFQNRRLQIPKDTNPEISVLIEACFSDDPRQRPSFASIMELLIKIIQKLSATAGAVNA